MKKIAVLIYPNFSLYEITCLTEAMMWFEQKVDIFASSQLPIRSEDGFQIIADKTLDKFSSEDYSCIILPGMMIPFDALFDPKLIDFLCQLKGKNILIGAISAAPMLLGQKQNFWMMYTLPPASGKKSVRLFPLFPTKTSCTNLWLKIKILSPP